MGAMEDVWGPSKQKPASEEEVRRLRRELEEARRVIAAAQRDLSSNATRALEDGAYWVRLGRRGARMVLDYRASR